MEFTLSPQTTYQVEVCAQNQVGEGKYSSTIVQTEPVRVTYERQRQDPLPGSNAHFVNRRRKNELLLGSSTLIGIIAAAVLLMILLVDLCCCACKVSSRVRRRPVREGVSKGEEDGHRPPALRAGHSPNGHKAVWGVARPAGIEAGEAGETLGSPWIPLPVWDWSGGQC
jgi:hypothetical protein